MFTRRTDKALTILRREPFWSLLYNHGRVAKAQARQHGGLSPSFGWMITRYLRTYVGHSLTHGERRDIVLLQAGYLRDRLNRAFFLELDRPREALWLDQDERRYSIWLSADRGRHLEGDFVLTFKLEGAAIYTLAFSIGPNVVNPAGGGVAMLIGRVQGERGRFDDIRRATKALNGIAPAALLVSAAEGIALALNLAHICGVAGSEQLSRLKQGAEYFDYDRFWQSLSGREVGGWYQFEAPFLHKAPSQTAPHHRRRARQRRTFRDGIREDVRAAFLQRFARRERPPTTTVDQVLGWARWIDRRLVPSTGLITALACALFYWLWPNDLVPDQTRYGRVDDVAIVMALAVVSVRMMTAQRSPAPRPIRFDR
jgi:uncharacterized protein VirK/YbjX